MKSAPPKSYLARSTNLVILERAIGNGLQKMLLNTFSGFAFSKENSLIRQNKVNVDIKTFVQLRKCTLNIRSCK